jgi:hypothetical protein
MKIIGEKLFEKSFSPNPFSKTFKQKRQTKSGANLKKYSTAVSTERTTWTVLHPNLVPSERSECGQTAVCPSAQARVPRTPKSRQFTKGRRLSPEVHEVKLHCAAVRAGHKIEK